jgi:hypothetical protein
MSKNYDDVLFGNELLILDKNMTRKYLVNITTEIFVVDSSFSKIQSVA